MGFLLSEFLPSNERKRMWPAIGITLFIVGLLTFLGIYTINNYGFALFVFTPFLIGFGPVALIGPTANPKMSQSILTGLLALIIFSAALMIFAIEGLICIAMAAPIGILLTIIGSIIGHKMVHRTPHKAPTALMLLIAVIPAMAFVEKDTKPELRSVITSIEIHADAQTVWKNVIEFPQLDKPTEFIFKTGIAYPVNAQIVGNGVGAIRHCNFTTGSFVEPITVWDEPRLLKFDVVNQPVPMKELSFWDIDAPHLHDYFVSEKGQFKLIPLENGNVLLEGTTWYHHRIAPAFYWKLWSDFIIHKIHLRVLNHIKRNAEIASGGPI